MSYGTIGSRRKVLIIFMMILVMMSTVMMPAGSWSAIAAEAETVYDDALHSLYADYSWAEVEWGYAGDAYSGTSSVRMEPDYGRVMYLYRDRILLATDYDRFEI